jgi:hypothetical protein
MKGGRNIFFSSKIYAEFILHVCVWKEQYRRIQGKDLNQARPSNICKAFKLCSGNKHLLQASMKASLGWQPFPALTAVVIISTQGPRGPRELKLLKNRLWFYLSLLRTFPPQQSRLSHTRCSIKADPGSKKLESDPGLQRRIMGCAGLFQPTTSFRLLG